MDIIPDETRKNGHPYEKLQMTQTLYFSQNNSNVFIILHVKYKMRKVLEHNIGENTGD
jgi:hypothetical protein